MCCCPLLLSTVEPYDILAPKQLHTPLEQTRPDRHLRGQAYDVHHAGHVEYTLLNAVPHLMTSSLSRPHRKIICICIRDRALFSSWVPSLPRPHQACSFPRSALRTPLLQHQPRTPTLFYPGIWMAGHRSPLSAMASCRIPSHRRIPCTAPCGHPPSPSVPQGAGTYTRTQKPFIQTGFSEPVTARSWDAHRCLQRPESGASWEGHVRQRAGLRMGGRPSRFPRTLRECTSGDRGSPSTLA
ncbi:hypothetical protein BC628DRAFT_1027477 [Trametes gibbosa]|nr:hypothetical protein BC628DRAFT_1027477 [Trametes gibbosa]